jgi:hypothetical protein
MPDTALSLVTSDASKQRTGRVTLLERKTAPEALAEIAGQARSGEGRLVLVEGEAGVGKSALLEQFTHDLPDSRLLTGVCDGMFTPRPLGPLFDIAQQVHGRLHSLCRADASREQLFDALLTELCEPGPLPAVVIEDVHWADEATLDLLGFLARRIREIAVLLIVSYRNDELADAHPLRIALGYLAVQRCTRRLPLAPLSAQAVRMLSAGREVDPAELYRVTGGNPFYVHAVLEAGLGEVPGSARDVVLARAARLARWHPIARRPGSSNARCVSRTARRLDTAMTTADGSTGHMYIGAVRLARAEARWLESDLTAARQEAELAADAFTDATDPWLNGEIAVWLRRTGSPRTSQARRIQANGGNSRREAGRSHSEVAGPPRTRVVRARQARNTWTVGP